MRPIFLSQVFTVRKSSGACRLIILVLYLIPTNWVSPALLLIESTRSTTHGRVSTKTSRNLKNEKNLFPAHLVERVVNRYLTLTHNECNLPVSVSDPTPTFYFKLPYIGPLLWSSKKGLTNL